MSNDLLLPARPHLLRVPQPLKIESLAEDRHSKRELLGGDSSDTNHNIKLLVDTSAHLNTFLLHLLTC